MVFSQIFFFHKLFYIKNNQHTLTFSHNIYLYPEFSLFLCFKTLTLVHTITEKIKFSLALVKIRYELCFGNKTIYNMHTKQHTIKIRNKNDIQYTLTMQCGAPCSQQSGRFTLQHRRRCRCSSRSQSTQKNQKTIKCYFYCKKLLRCTIIIVPPTRSTACLCLYVHACMESVTMFSNVQCVCLCVLCV